MHQQLVRFAQGVLISTCGFSAGLAQQAPAPRTEPLAAPSVAVKYAAPTVASMLVTETRPPVNSALAEPVRQRASVASATFARGADHSRVYIDSDSAGTIWARGADYKASFDTTGAKFVPFFGSHAPRNFELHLALTSVSCGAVEFALDDSVAPQRAESVVRFDRGEVDELYELSTRGVEQKFLFDSLPAAGELRLRVGFESELLVEADAHGWRFGNEHGYVHYGQATAIDAAGRSLALGGELVGGAFEFVVPADFVAHAALPLVIDPWIAGYAVEVGSITSLSPDVVYDGSGYYAMHCWEEVYSAADHDVYSVVYDIYGNVISATAAYIDYTTTSWERPRCAYQAVSDRYAFTAQVGAPGGRGIYAVVRSPYAGFSSGQVQVSDPSTTGEKFNADIGGDPHLGPAYFCVVYERAYSASDHDVHARLVDGNGVVTGATILVDDSGSTFDAVPSISKTNDTNNWNIVWQRTIAAGDRDIFGARVFWQGSITFSTFAIPSSFRDDSNPSVSGPQRGTQRYVVAHERFFNTDHDIELTLMDGATVLQQINLSIAEGSSYTRDQILPAVECDGAHFACAYSEPWGGGPTYGALLAEFGPSGNALFVNQKHQLLSATGDDERTIAIAAPASSHQANWGAQYVTSWSAIGSGHSDIVGATFNGSSGGTITFFCEGTAATCPCGNGTGSGGGCGNSANPFGAILEPFGAASTTNDTLTLSYWSLPPGVSALLFQGVNLINGGAGAVFGDGKRCVAAPVYRFPLRATDGSGYAQYGFGSGDVPISVAGSVPYYGVSMNYQVWFRDGASYCTSANTNFTNALTVNWTP